MRAFTKGATGVTTTTSIKGEDAGRAGQAATAETVATSRRRGGAAPAAPRNGKGGSQRQPKAYREGAGWCLRQRYQGHEVYVSGHSTAAAAKKEARERCVDIDKGKLPARGGAEHNTVAQALQDYALERLPFMKGAEQEARRFNNYLRAAGLQTLVVTRRQQRVADPRAAGEQAPEEQHSQALGSDTEVEPDGDEDQARDPDAKDSKEATKGKKHKNKKEKKPKPKTVYFDVTLEPWTTERKIPQGLAGHRRQLLTESADTEKHRAVLATMPVSEVKRAHLQALVDTMRSEERSAATIALERSIFRVLFSYALTHWNWSCLADNPACGLKMPQVDNVRKRTFSKAEQAALDEALQECRNTVAAAAIVLLRETAMRASEPLLNATWGDVDWNRSILTLRDDKAGGGREVVLNALAIKTLRELGPGEPDEPILRTSYEAVKAAMRRACERAGIEDARLHDLRRTAATHIAKLSGGNAFMVQVATGHRTLAMAQRYVQLSVQDLLELHNEHEARLAENGNATATEDAQAAPAPAGAALTFSADQMRDLAQALATAMASASQPTGSAQQTAKALTAPAHDGNVVPFERRAA